MNKTQLIEAVVAKTGMKKKDADAAIAATFASIMEALTKNDKVQVSGFGSFDTKQRAARTGRNPHTGAEIKIAAYKCASYSPSKALKDAINK